MSSDPQPVLVHSYTGLLGGSERILLDLLARWGKRPLLACPPGPLADAAESAGTAVLRLRPRPLEARGGLAPARSASDAFGHGREAWRIARDVEPSLILSWGMRSAVGLVIASRLSRAGRTQPPPIVVEHVDLLPAGRQGAIARRSLLAADRIICLSHAIADDLDPGHDHRDRISVVHPGVEFFEADLRPDQDDSPSALVLAAIEPWKGQADALEAVALVPGLRLRLAGTPLSERGREYESQLRERASREDLRGRVDFAGTVDPAEALRSATLLLHPAPAEPFGRAMAEALAAARPVIAVDAAGAREIVNDDCGQLVPAGDVQAMAGALRDVISDPERARALGSAGRERAQRMFDPDRQASLWVREVEGAITSSSSGAETGSDTMTRAADGADLSIVTVIHDSAADLERLLASITRHLPEAEVIVVDSGSNDGGAGIAAGWEGTAQVIALDGNPGFGAGCVAGIERATRRVTAFVNPDVEFVDRSVASLAAELAAPESADALLCPLLIHPDGRRQDSVHPLPGSAAELLRAIVPAAALPGGLAALAEPHRSDRPRRVGWAVGACLLGRTATLRSLGPFDPKVHLYAEDLDLCLKAAREGIPTWHRPDARAIHREGHSTLRAFGGEPSQLLATRRREVVASRLGRAALRRDDAIQALTLIDRIAIKSLLRRDTSLERERLAALAAARGRKR